MSNNFELSLQSIGVLSVQGLAPPPAKKTAGQIEKETDERRTPACHA
jgi:hypothetical protein